MNYKLESHLIRYGIHGQMISNDRSPHTSMNQVKRLFTEKWGINTLPQHLTTAMLCKSKRKLTLGRTCKFIPPPWYKRGAGGGGGGGWNPPRSFWYVAVFRNDFTLSGKPLIFLARWGIFYGWWRCWGPVTSRFYQALEIRLKRWEIVIFVLYIKHNT